MGCCVYGEDVSIYNRYLQVGGSCASSINRNIIRWLSVPDIAIYHTHDCSIIHKILNTWKRIIIKFFVFNEPVMYQPHISFII